MTLVEFLTARLDEDEALAREAVRWNEGCSKWADGGEPDWVHIARHDPARVLAEVAAKRKIVEEHPIRKSGDEEGCECNYDREWGWAEEGACGTLRALASVYADHPDFDPAWR